MGFYEFSNTIKSNSLETLICGADNCTHRISSIEGDIRDLEKKLAEVKQMKSELAEKILVINHTLAG